MNDSPLFFSHVLLSPLFCFSWLLSSCLLSIPHTSCLFKILLFLSLFSPPAPPLSSGPAPLKSLHCFPLSSSSLSCSWSPPLSDFDSYEVECRQHDDGELTSALRLAEGITAVTLDHLEAYRKYSVTVRVSSAGQTSPPATHTTITMIDRELHAYTHTRGWSFRYFSWVWCLNKAVEVGLSTRDSEQLHSSIINFRWQI